MRSLLLALVVLSCRPADREAKVVDSLRAELTALTTGWQWVSQVDSMTDHRACIAVAFRDTVPTVSVAGDAVGVQPASGHGGLREVMVRIGTAPMIDVPGDPDVRLTDSAMAVHALDAGGFRLRAVHADGWRWEGHMDLSPVVAHRERLALPSCPP